MLPLLPVSPLTEVKIPLLTRGERKSRRCEVMLPPLAVEVSAWVEMAAPSFIKRRDCRDGDRPGVASAGRPCGGSRSGAGNAMSEAR